MTSWINNNFSFPQWNLSRRYFASRVCFPVMDAILTGKLNRVQIPAFPAMFAEKLEII